MFFLDFLSLCFSMAGPHWGIIKVTLTTGLASLPGVAVAQHRFGSAATLITGHV